MKAVLSSNPSIVVLASEEDDTVITCGSSSSGSGGYAVVFDPLDGSRNIDAAIPTGRCRAASRGGSFLSGCAVHCWLPLPRSHSPTCVLTC